jgi:UDP-N-acetylmuramyl pentapeptide phosphotransferase/UDP-N-acetylglucosamine-1-phosphate transferase
VMVVTSVTMVLLGMFMLISGETIGLVLLVFGGIGAVLSYTDLRTLSAGRIDSKQRIAEHLTRMLAGTIATITAFLVTNVSIEPVFLLWLAPTVVITPLIVWWNRRIQAGEKPRGMPEGPQ